MRHRPTLPILILCAGTSLLHGQAIVEHGAIDGKTAAAAAGAGKSVLGVLRQMGNASDAAAKVGNAPQPARASAAQDFEAPLPSPPPPAPAAARPSFSVVTVGMERAELVRLFGKPSMSVSGMEAHALTETFWYQTATENITVVLRDGKVFSITRVEKPAAK